MAWKGSLCVFHTLSVYVYEVEGMYEGNASCPLEEESGGKCIALRQGVLLFCLQGPRWDLM